jgi:hypothetical protein
MDEDMVEVVEVEMIFDRVNMGGATTQHDEGTSTLRPPSETASSPNSTEEVIERKSQELTIEEAEGIDRLLFPPAVDPPPADAYPNLDATLTHDATIMVDDSAIVAVRPPSKVDNVLLVCLC